MRLAVIHCIFLACTAVTLAEEPRPRRHLHQIKEMIVKKLFSSSEPNCTQPTEAPAAPPQLETKYFRIPGFNNVVVKAVPKGSTVEPAPVYDELPPNSHIGIVGSYLGTNTLNDTYNALLGVKNLLTSGILSAKRDMWQEFNQPPKVNIVAVPGKLAQPCAAPGLRPLPLEPVRVIVKPPKLPVVPTQYSYKQVNQDGSLTTYSSSLNLENGVKVTEDGKTLPFFINRVQKIPVHLPVPVLPEVSKIIVSEVVHPASTYSYQQIHQDGRLTSYMGLPSVVSMPGPVVVTETVKRIPPPPIFLMDRIEKVAAIASFPRAPLTDVASKPVAMNAQTGYVTNAPVVGSPRPAPGPVGYSYSQMNINGGTTTHSASGDKDAAVRVTENRSNAFPSLPENNPFSIPARSGGYSYSQVHSGSITTSNGVGQQSGPVHVIEHGPISASTDILLPPNSFSYKQIGDGKITTYTGSGKPSVIEHGMNHPIPPPHITDRIEKVAAGAKFNRPPFLPMPIAFPVPTGFVRIPSIHTIEPQRPVKKPLLPQVSTKTSSPSSFSYKHIHNDGSVTSYDSNGLTTEEGKTYLPPPANMAMPFPQGNVRVFESPIYSGPFPMNPTNHNAVKPSTPVSGSFSYKMVNSDMQRSHPPVGPIDRPIVDSFAPPPPVPIMPAPIQGCIDSDATTPVVADVGNPMVGSNPILFENPVPLTYSYKQISHSNPNPFLVVNVEDPIMDVKKVNMKLSHNNQPYQRLPPPPANPFLSVNAVEHKPVAFVQPAPLGTLPIVNIPVPQGSMEIAPPSSFSYKQVTSQDYQPLPPPPQPAVNVIEHKPFVPPQINGMRLQQHSTRTSPPSSFSYKQVTRQDHQPMINTRVPQMEKDNAPSYSYKQVTNQGLYDNSDEFPMGVKTNLSPNSLKPQETPSNNANVEQKPLPNPSFAAPIPAGPMPNPSNPKPDFDRHNSLANNPIVVPEQSSFSFKSSNPDGSTITVKGDGHNGMAVQLEASKAEPTIPADQEPRIPIPPVVSANEALVNESSTKAVPDKETPGPVSGHAKPLRRRVLKRKPVKNRGDIPDSE